MSWIRSLLALAVGLVCACRTTSPGPSAGSTSDAPPSSSQPIRITLIGTNDTHGWVYAQKSKLASGQEIDEGGSAAFAGYLAILRSENPGGTILLDAGDLFQGTLASNITEGEVVIAVYNQLGYQASAIGNHEFDYGPVGPVSVASSPEMDPFGALKARMQQAHFPLLAANIYDAKTGIRPAWLGNDGTTLLEVKGVKVGILGLVTPSTPFTTNPVNVASLRFGSLAPEAAAAAKRLRDRGAEIVIAVAHAGGRCSNLTNPRDLSSCDTKSGEIFEMLEQIPAGTVDAVVAGHTHAPIGHFVGETPVIETSGLGRSFGTIDLYLDGRSHKVIADRTVVKPAIPICLQAETTTGQCDANQLKHVKQPKFEAVSFLGKPVTPDGDVQKIIDPVLAQVEKDQHRKLGIKIPEALTRHYEGESTLGDVLADGLREMESADLALLNPGGLRSDVPAGDLSYGDIYDVLPFDNTIASVTLTGEELKRLLAAAFGGHKGIFQISGMTVQLGKCPSPARFKDASFAGGKPIVADKKYKLALPDFLARGGDGLGPVMSSLPADRVDLGTAREFNFRDGLVAFWQKKTKSLVAPKPGRISYVDDGSVCEAPGKTGATDPSKSPPPKAK